MKEEILKLRSEGKKYYEIQKALNCSKSIVSYYCGVAQKDKSRKRQAENRMKCNETTIICKTTNFKYCRIDKSKKLRISSTSFQKRPNKIYEKDITLTFDWKDVIDKFGEDTFCYLSGEKINLINDKNYNLDHIVPKTRGGENNLENLGILHETVNKMKGALLNEELFEWCIKILKHNGYDVVKNKIIND